ncbi:MAG TPA: TIGR02281 family clan AA aspartic protease [Xanthobacteraceae bacterium]|nr:TIGR02281 family clan AA aspartic protease [Xanthobacteraceae bacterium]
MSLLRILVVAFVAVGVVVAYYADRTLTVRHAKTTNAEVSTSERGPGVTVSQPAALPASPQSVAPPPAKPHLPQVITLSPRSRTVTLRDDGSGHFRAEGRIDGRRVDFLVDTGATAVVLRASTAAQLGIRPSRSDYTVKIITGNGETRAALVQLGKVEVGDIVVRDVRALIQQDDTLAVDLLGMTFLSKIKWTHDRGQLVLEQ